MIRRPAWLGRSSDTLKRIPSRKSVGHERHLQFDSIVPRRLDLTSMVSVLGHLLQAARPRQWTKNFVVFAAIIFSQNLGDKIALAKVAGAFAVFCMLSSAIYFINDVIDTPQDKLHPVKSHRPIAAGKIGRSEACIWAVVFLIVAMGAAFALNVQFGCVCLGYTMLQLLYMFWLKHQVILDVLCIAIGFVLRAVGGGMVIHILISHWLMVCTLFLALFLAVCKRRHELVLFGESSSLYRKALSHYSESLLDQMVAVVTSSTVITYALYTVSPETQSRFGSDHLKYTVPFVLYGIFRYLYLVYRKEEGGNPEGLLLGDKPLLVNIVLFTLTVAVLIYGR